MDQISAPLKAIGVELRGALDAGPAAAVDRGLLSVARRADEAAVAVEGLGDDLRAAAVAPTEPIARELQEIGRRADEAARGGVARLGEGLRAAGARAAGALGGVDFGGQAAAVERGNQALYGRALGAGAWGMGRALDPAIAMEEAMKAFRGALVEMSGRIPVAATVSPRSRPRPVRPASRSRNCCPGPR